MATRFDQLSPTFRAVLDALWRCGPSSRSEIAALTRLTRPAITLVVNDMTQLGLLMEQPSRKGQRGQPARPLTVCGSAGFTVGVNFSHSYLELALIDLSGAIIDTARMPLVRPSPETIADTAMARLKPMMRAHGLQRERLLGIGISLPGDFDVDGSLLPHVMFPDLRAGDLRERFASALEAPVFLENDGRACAIGERLMGVGRSYRTFMLVHLGHGVGGGLIVDGKPYRGALGNAGILGQYYPYGQPRPSGLDLLETLQSQGFAINDFDALENLPDDAAATVNQWVKRAAAQLSHDIARIGRFFGPEAIVLAGRLPPLIATAVAEAIDLEGVLRKMDDLPIPPLKASLLGSSAGAIGAASLPIYTNFMPTD